MNKFVYDLVKNFFIGVFICVDKRLINISTNDILTSVKFL